MAFDLERTQASRPTDVGKAQDASFNDSFEAGHWRNRINLPDDSAGWTNDLVMPDDCGAWQDHIDLPEETADVHSQPNYQVSSKEGVSDSQLHVALDLSNEDPDSSNCKRIVNDEVGNDTGDQSDIPRENTSDAENVTNEYSDLNSMKRDLGKTYSEIKEEKPQNSPNISKWFQNGGTIRIEKVDGKSVWTYTDSEGRSVQYIDGKVKFPPEAKHPIIEDISIGEFTGDRNKDKQLYLKKLEEEYGLTEVPDGYALHHDTENGVMQLVRIDYHKEFTHAGGHSMYKEDE